jgi:hypothetical protein
MNSKVLRQTLAACLLSCLAWSAQAALNLADTVPIGPQVKVGKLERIGNSTA